MSTLLPGRSPWPTCTRDGNRPVSHAVVRPLSVGGFDVARIIGSHTRGRHRSSLNEPLLLMSVSSRAAASCSNQQDENRFSVGQPGPIPNYCYRSHQSPFFAGGVVAQRTPPALRERPGSDEGANTRVGRSLWETRNKQISSLMKAAPHTT